MYLVKAEQLMQTFIIILKPECALSSCYAMYMGISYVETKHLNSQIRNRSNKHDQDIPPFY